MPTFGPKAKIDSLEIRWPDGSRETRTNIPSAARLLVQKQGGGTGAAALNAHP